MLILVTNGGLTLNADESQKLSNALLQLLSKDTALLEFSVLNH